MKKILALLLAVLLLVPMFTAFATEGLATETTLDGVVVVPVSSFAVNTLTVGEPTVVCDTVASMRTAIFSAEPGAIIGIKSGTYEMSGLKLNFGGKDGVTLRSVTGDPDDVVLLGTGFHKADRANGDVDEPVYIATGAKNITIYGITIKDSNCHGVKLDGTETLDNIIVDNCKFFNINERMIKGTPANDVRKGVSNLRISNNWFENDMIPVPSDHDPSFAGDYIAGMDLMNLNGAVVSDNTFINIRGYLRGARGGIFLWNGCKNVVAERNLFIGCDRGVCFGNPAGSDSKVAEHMDGAVARNNVIIDAHDIGIELGRVGRVEVYNNTIMNRLSKDARGITQSFTKGEEIVVKNNLVWNVINCPDAIVENNFSDFDESYFVNVSAGDMRLTEMAVGAAGKGLPLAKVEDDITGTKRHATNPSIGAYEYDGEIAVVKTFDDIQGRWFQAPVEFMATKGYINGTTDKTFSPQDTITRAQFLAILMRIADKPDSDANGSFADVAEDKYYTQNVKTAKANGILTDHDGPNFRPNDPVTREDAFTWIARSLELSTPDDRALASFPDANLISYPEAAECIAALIVAGYVKGSDGKINPLSTMTRAEGAQVLFNIL